MFHPFNHLVCTGNFSSNLTNSSALKRETSSRVSLFETFMERLKLPLEKM